jgi:hypothetical protein
VLVARAAGPQEFAESEAEEESKRLHQSLERRLKDTPVPGGWRPFGTQTWAIRGHEFGLDLPPEKREQLIAFLRIL